jgi:5-(carboxyamino)imidazole ribonucleotide synthase
VTSTAVRRVGVLGGGQLGRMLALAGYPLGIRLKHIGSAHDTSAREVAEQIVADYGDQAALAHFAQGVEVITYEWENVPVEAAHFLEQFAPVHPRPAALECSQDRLVEKSFFRQLGIPTASFEQVDSLGDLRAAVHRLGLPAVLKTRRLGYDGKGQAVLTDRDTVEKAWSELSGSPLILEGFMQFSRELSIIAVRSISGDCRFYPLIENTHAQGILRLSLAPAQEITPALQGEAESIARRVLERLDYAGVLTIELFQCGEQLLANEMAPRVHNSGHWTIEGAETSQFENHLRAILDLPLGSTAPLGGSAMLNLIGDLPDTDPILACRDAHLHLYGKHARTGRKLGHVTIRRSSNAEAAQEAKVLAEKLGVLTVPNLLPR